MRVIWTLIDLDLFGVIDGVAMSISINAILNSDRSIFIVASRFLAHSVLLEQSENEQQRGVARRVSTRARLRAPCKEIRPARE